LTKLSGKVVSHVDVLKYDKESDPEDDCKTIIVKDKKRNYYALAVRGMMRIDFSKAKEAIGKKISILDQKELKKITGKDPGSVCLLLLKNMKIFVDKRILEREKMHFSSGHPLYGLGINTKDLDKVIKFDTVDIAQ